MNKTLIALIPKKKKPTRLEEFRPINLCTAIYKIIAKALANRMKRVLNDIISLSQSAFVPGRVITDNEVIGFECIHSINSRKKRKNRSIKAKARYEQDV